MVPDVAHFHYNIQEIIVFPSPETIESVVFAARAVYQAPLLTVDECRHIIDMAHAAAERNAEFASKEAAKQEFLRGAGIISRVDDEADDFIQQHQRNNNEGHVVEGRTLLDEPKGWTKDRHTSYPTTDLNLVTDPFTTNDRDFLKKILDARLAPLLERVYGIAPDDTTSRMAKNH